MTETTTALRRRERDLWGQLIEALFDLALFILLGIALHHSVRDGDWPLAALAGVMFLALSIEHAANKVVRAIEESA